MQRGTSDRDGALSGVRVLVVEDVPDTREVLERLLEADGASVVSAGSAREAVEIAMARDFDVLLTDLGLPDIPGDVLIRKVVADACRRPRVIAITGYGEPYTNRALTAGAHVVLTKPVAWSELLGSLGATEPDAVPA